MNGTVIEKENPKWVVLADKSHFHYHHRDMIISNKHVAKDCLKCNAEGK